MPIVPVFGGGSSTPDPLSWVAPATVTRPSGSTTATVTWPSPTGGVAPYSYSDPGVAYDSQGAATTALVSTVGLTTSLTGLVNSQVVVLSRTAIDAAGTVVTVQAVVTVAASAATLTFATTPGNQSLPSTATSVTLGTWGAASGGTPAYNYALTELSAGGVTLTGSGQGPWSGAGLTSGQTYAFLMTVTDSLGAKGYSVITVSVAAAENLGEYELVDELDLQDSNWTAFSTTSTTASTTAWYATLMAADGVTPRAYIFNNSTEPRTLSLSPSGDGLKLVNGAITNQPWVGVWPAGWTPLLGGSRNDLWMVEAIVGGREPSGALGFVHIQNLGTTSYTTPGTGLRVINSSSSSMLRAVSYITSLAEQAIQTIAPGTYRDYTCGLQVTINNARQHDIYVRPMATGFAAPQTGQRVRVQVASGAMTAPGGDYTTSAAWFATTILGRAKLMLYHDGSATSNSEVTLKKIRLLRIPGGSR